MNSRFLKLSLANFGYKYSKKTSKLPGSVLLYVGASFLLLAIIATVFNFVIQSGGKEKTAGRMEKTITAEEGIS